MVSPRAYHRTAVVVFEVLEMLWWLAAWPSLAWAASQMSACSSYYTSYGIFGDFCTGYPLLATAAALAAVEWYDMIVRLFVPSPKFS